MNNLLSYLFDEVKLKETVFDEWAKIYDPEYLDSTIFIPMDARRDKLSPAMNRISQKATGKLSALAKKEEEDKEASLEMEVPKFVPTKQVPFKLSQGKPKKLPEPIKIPNKVERKPVPSFVHERKMEKMKEDQSEIRKKNQENLKKKYEESSVQRFILETDTRPTKIEKLLEEEEEKMKQVLQFDKKYVSPPKNWDETKAEVRLTAAAILRENNMIEKDEKKKQDYLKQVEWNMRDSNEFNQWKEKQKELEDLEKQEKQHIRKVEMKISHQAAIRAVEDNVEKKKENADDLKVLKKKELRKKERLMKENKDYKLGLKATVTASKGMAEVKRKEQLKTNKKLHDEQIEKAKAEQELKGIEVEEERKKRDAIIRKIRELERNIERPKKTVDYDSIAGLGLFNEMSLNQMVARYEELKKEFKEQEERRRDTNAKEKDKKLEGLHDKVSTISKAREDRRAKHKEEREAKLAADRQKAENEKRIAEDSQLEAYDRIKDKKLKKRLEQKETRRIAREIKLRNQYMQANAQKVEENAWKSNQEGAEREIKSRQNEKLIDQERKGSINWKEKNTIATNNLNMLDTKQKQISLYGKRFEEEKKASEELMKQNRNDKKESYKEVKSQEMEHHENMVLRNPFAYKITEQTFKRTEIMSNV